MSVLRAGVQSVLVSVSFVTLVACSSQPTTFINKDGRHADAKVIEAPSKLPSSQLVAGSEHTCIVAEDQQARCFGNHQFGRLGIETRYSIGIRQEHLGVFLRSVSLGHGRTVRRIGAGAEHTCAILDDGLTKCWGGNSWGQLGLGDSKDRGIRSLDMGSNLPYVAMGYMRRAKAIVPGHRHTCAILDDDSLKCWGANSWGQLGLEHSDNRGQVPGQLGNNLEPVALGIGRSVKQVSLGASHTCALLDNGSVKCWGRNQMGELGQNNKLHRGNTREEMGDKLPIVDFGVKGSVVQIASGIHHNCALLEDGTVRCWGFNEFGQLGLGHNREVATNDSNAVRLQKPVDFGSNRKAKSIAAGGHHSCAILDNDSLKCWGANESGQLGLGHTQVRGTFAFHMGDRLSAVSVGSTRTVKHVTLGDAHTCVTLDNGTHKCWGRNHVGQLGLGDTLNRGDKNNQMGDQLPALRFD